MRWKSLVLERWTGIETKGSRGIKQILHCKLIFIINIFVLFFYKSKILCYLIYKKLLFTSFFVCFKRKKFVRCIIKIFINYAIKILLLKEMCVSCFKEVYNKNDYEKDYW